MQIKQTIIKSVDLIKLLERKKMTLKDLAVKAGVNYEYLLRCKDGHRILSDDLWKQIKKYL